MISGVVAAEQGGQVAWFAELHGVRNVWIKDGPSTLARQVTHYTEDDGQELTQLRFSADGARLIYVRGGDAEANWPAEGGLAPNPNSSPQQPAITIWSTDASGAGDPIALAEGNVPTPSPRGDLAFLKGGQVWITKVDGSSKPRRLFFDRGHDRSLVWSPDGARLAFVSDRTDHAFIGIYRDEKTPLLYLAPSTSSDDQPRWSPDGHRIAFARSLGTSGPPAPLMRETPQPWSIWTADTSSGQGMQVWSSPDTLWGSYPDLEGGPKLQWVTGDRLVFLANLDGWPHLYSIPEKGGKPLLLTPGAFGVDDLTQSPDHRTLVYSANTGTLAGDEDRHHLFRVSVDRGDVVALTRGTSLETAPTFLSDGRVAFLAAGPTTPPELDVFADDGAGRTRLGDLQASRFPREGLVQPQLVRFRAPDGQMIEGQLFQRAGGAAAKPGIVFVHGGPQRQLLLGWPATRVYSNHFALNQFLAAQGFVVLSINYRRSMGYGYDFAHPANGGPPGVSEMVGAVEYQDVLAAGRLLAKTPGVDGNRIGIWGSSYGGYLTALALARNSDLFKAGADIYGVSDASSFMALTLDDPNRRFEKGDREEAMKSAWLSSPASAVANWRSPVLLVHGDDDRNVPFQQTIDLAERLRVQHVPTEQIVIPDEVHDFRRYASWLKVDEAVAKFLADHLQL